MFYTLSRELKSKDDNGKLGVTRGRPANLKKLWHAGPRLQLESEGRGKAEGSVKRIAWLPNLESIEEVYSLSCFAG